MRAVTTCLLSALLLPLPAAAGDINVYNWAGYIGEETVAAFEAESGLEVTYDTFDTLETLEAKLLAGNSGYDLVVYVGPYAPRLIEIGVFRPLDRARLPGWENLDPAVLPAFAESDPGNEHGLPYLWSTTGITYNVAQVTERLGGIPENAADLIFDPAVAAKLADCGISLFDSPTDILPLALAYWGYAPSSDEAADYEAIAGRLAAVRPYVRHFDNQQYNARLAAGELCVATTWSGDYARAEEAAAEAGRPVELGYGIPETGAPIWFDAFFIPADAPHAEAAHDFLAYLLRPEVMAEISEELKIASANAAATALLPAELTENPAIYPDQAVKERLFVVRPLSHEAEQARTRLWTRFKTGR